MDDCVGATKEDALQTACSSWCKSEYLEMHCAWCKCRACDFCAEDAEEEASFPSHEGHWDCESEPPTWWDDERQSLTSAHVDTVELTAALSNRWVVLVGDSSVRMLFHFLLGMLTASWQQWPAELSEGKGPARLPHAWAASLQNRPRYYYE